MAPPNPWAQNLNLMVDVISKRMPGSSSSLGKIGGFRAPENLGFTEVSSQNQPEYLTRGAPFFNDGLL